MMHLLIGLLAASGFFLLVRYAAKRSLPLKSWHWVLTALVGVYLVFVVEAIYTLLIERAGSAAAVTGVVLGLPAAIAVVLLARYVFSPARPVRG